MSKIAYCSFLQLMVDIESALYTVDAHPASFFLISTPTIAAFNVTIVDIPAVLNDDDE